MNHRWLITSPGSGLADRPRIGQANPETPYFLERNCGLIVQLQLEIATMFCPRCSCQNSDDTKFCRACGTNLATVTLALADPNQLSEAALERLASISLAKRRAAISALINGTGWISASTVIGVALGLFSNTNDWIYVWLGLASWMACWGIILWSQGINKLVEARSLQRELGVASGGMPKRVTHELASRETVAPPEVPTTNKLAQPRSISEHTTDLLNR